MSFEAIYNTRGQKVPMFGILKELKGGGMTANNKPYAKVSITDDTGKISNVKIYGEALPQAQQIGQRLQWTISTYDYVYNGKAGVAFSGFWNNTAQVAGTQQVPKTFVPNGTPSCDKAMMGYQEQPKQTYLPDNDRQDDIKFGQAANLAMQQCLIDKSVLMFEDYQQKYYKFLINRKMPTKMPVPTQEPEYDDVATESREQIIGEMDIPF